MGWKTRYKELMDNNRKTYKSIDRDMLFNSMKKIMETGLFEKKLLSEVDPITEFHRNLKAWLFLGEGKNKSEFVQFQEKYVEDMLTNTQNGLIILSANSQLLNGVNLEQVDKSKLIIPFKTFFIDAFITYIDEKEKEIYMCRGVIVKQRKSIHKDKGLIFEYFWSKSIDDGMSFIASITNDYTNLNEDQDIMNLDSKRPELPFERRFIVQLKEIILKVVYLIQTKKYREYQRYTPEGYEKKTIVYESEVKSHKRHFYKESGHFKIPFLSDEEIYKKGYGIDDVVVMESGDIRERVPYTEIGTFKRNEGEKTQNREISLIKKKNYAKEEKLGKLLNEIYIGEIILHNTKIHKSSNYRFDYFIPKLRLAFEYDGEQHFDKELYEKLYKEGFEEQRIRDRQKNALCRRLKIKLIRIKYDEPLTIGYIRKRIKLGY